MIVFLKPTGHSWRMLVSYHLIILKPDKGGELNIINSIFPIQTIPMSNQIVTSQKYSSLFKNEL